MQENEKEGERGGKELGGEPGHQQEKAVNGKDWQGRLGTAYVHRPLAARSCGLLDV